MLSVNVTTYHYNNAETGANTNETQLTLANVNSASFGKVASMAVDGQIYGQPLIVTGVAMANGQGTHDIVLVTTENDSVYAFDAYGNDPAQGYLWKTSLLAAGETPVPESIYGSTDITPELGITGTPVVDQSTGRIYVVGLFQQTSGSTVTGYSQRIYALNIASGTNAVTPVTIAASVSGSTFSNSTYVNPGGVVTFSAFRENQRPALTLANGEVYVGWSSHGDQDPWHGWVIAFNAATLNEDYVYCNTTDGEQGGIWMSGGGIAVDSSGNLYFTSGNGTFDANTNTGVTGDYSMTIEKLSPSLVEEDYFAPYNQSSLSNDDLDYGCANVIILTGQTGSAPNEVITAGKWGTIFLNNSNTGSLGEFNSTTNNDLGSANITTNTGTSNVHNTLAYWNGSVYLGGDALPIEAFAVGNSTLGSTYSSETSHVFGSASIEDGQGAGLTVSSNGSSNGILWAADNTGFLTSPAILYAYNASSLSQTPLWTSSAAANGRDTASVAIKFQDPVVANGHVYLAGDGSLTVYGLLSSSTGTPTVATAASATPANVTGTTTTLGVAGTDPTGDLSPTYTWTATTVPTGATKPTFSNNGTNNANNTIATFYKAGSYTFTATIEDPNSGNTVTSLVTVTVSQTVTGLTVSPSAVTVNDNGTVQLTASSTDQFGAAMTTQPTFTWTVVPGGFGGTVNATGLYTAPASGTGTDTVMVASGSLTASSKVTVVLPTSTYQIPLAGYYNQFGIATAHTISNGGIDGDNDGLSASLIATASSWTSGILYSWNGSSFNIGSSTTANNTDNVVSALGQTITLTPGHYSAVKILGLRVQGSATETITFNYTDGTSSTVTQGFSDWYTPQSYAGESKAVSMSSRVIANGHNGTGPFYIYGYSLAPIYSENLQSVTLPNDADVMITSLDAVGTLSPTLTVPASANPAAVNRTTTVLSMLGTDPAGDASPTYTWAATNIPSGAATPTFTPNGTASSNVSTATFYAAGVYTFTGTLTDPTTGFTVTSSVNVTVSQTLTAINVTPAGPVALTNGQTQQYTASAVDQFGNGLAAQPGFTWTLATGGIGSVSTTGLYTAPSTGTGNATVVATSGTVTGSSTVSVNLPAWLGTGSQASWNSATRILTVTGPTSIVADPGSDQPVIEANTSAGVITINPATALQIHIGGLSLTNGASAVVTSLGAARTASNHRVLVLGLPGAASVPLLTIDSSSHLDLADNDLVDHDGSPAAVTGLLTAGFDYGAGYWNGTGIDSSIAAAATLTALGVEQVPAAGTVDQEPVGTADVEVRYTYYGDANLDGKVDGSDYSLIDAGYASAGALTGWANGDFNYDGVIDGTDYTLIDNAFNTQNAPLAGASAETAATVGVVAPAPRVVVQTPSTPRVLASAIFAAGTPVTAAVTAAVTAKAATGNPVPAGGLIGSSTAPAPAAAAAPASAVAGTGSLAPPALPPRVAVAKHKSGKPDGLTAVSSVFLG